LVSPKPPVTITGDAGAGRHQEWLKFLRVIDDVTPRDKDLHLSADNYATHKHPKVQRWLARHPRFLVYFTPTSSSWLNMVERFFRDPTEQRLRRGYLPRCRRTDHGDRRLHRQAQRQPEAVRMDSESV
jgi:transposase